MENPQEVRITPRYLDPATTHIFIGRLGSLHCVVDEREAFANVHCVLCFLVTQPDRYISVCYSDEWGKEHEIGVIEDLNAFPEAVRGLVQYNLRRYYYERTITRIHSVSFDYGVLFLDVDTPDGRTEFMMRWEHDKAQDFGKSGKILLDVFDNRYLIPAVQDLPDADKNRLRRFIYW